MPNKLPNYLLSHRKRAGFTQAELAFLLGIRNGAGVSRHERHGRVPRLETALAYEAMFGVPARELFAGTYARIERHTMKRARALARRLAAAPKRGTTVQKLAWLETLLREAASRGRRTP